MYFYSDIFPVFFILSIDKYSTQGFTTVQFFIQIPLVPCVPFHTNIQVRQQWRWACNLWFCATHNMGGLATLYIHHQTHTNTMSTANHSVSKYRNQAQKLEEKLFSKVIGQHHTDNVRVGWDHQIHTSWPPRMIRNRMYTRFYQVPFQLCLTTSLLATDCISHEGPRFFTLVQPWRTSINVFCLIPQKCACYFTKMATFSGRLWEIPRNVGKFELSNIYMITKTPWSSTTESLESFCYRWTQNQ